jgi:pimeloyl-ACP methyl ester carboxylesterase
MSFIKSLIRIVVGVFIAIPLLLYPYLYLAQEKLLFIQQKRDSEHLSWVKREYPDAEEVRIKTPDNVMLHGWYVKNSSEQQSSLVIYFGGNAEEVSKHVRELNYFKGWSLLLVNYRGYGLSEGDPNEKNFFNDAVLLYDTFAQRTDIDNQRIIAFGRSLGTGVAVYLASKRHLKGVILVSPYDSIRSMAQEIYPYVPVSFLLKHHFDSLAFAPSIKTPMLALIAQNDRIIPPHHSLALIEAWGGTTQHFIISDSDHNNISATSYEYWERIMAFLLKMK